MSKFTILIPYSVCKQITIIITSCKYIDRFHTTLVNNLFITLLISSCIQLPITHSVLKMASGGCRNMFTIKNLLYVYRPPTTATPVGHVDQGKSCHKRSFSRYPEGISASWNQRRSECRNMLTIKKIIVYFKCVINLQLQRSYGNIQSCGWASCWRQTGHPYFSSGDIFLYNWLMWHVI